MARVTSANYTVSNFTWGTVGGDQFFPDQVELLAQAVESHDHTNTKGLAVGRVISALAIANPAFSGTASGSLTNLALTTPTLTSPTITTPAATGGTYSGGNFTVPTVTTRITSAGAAVTAAAGAAAGAGPPNPGIGANSVDMRGAITFGTGTGPSAGGMVQVTFSAALTHACITQVTPVNAATQALGLYVTSQDTGKFIVACVNAPAASQGFQTYGFHYHVDD